MFAWLQQCCMHGHIFAGRYVYVHVIPLHMPYLSYHSHIARTSHRVSYSLNHMYNVTQIFNYLSIPLCQLAREKKLQNSSRSSVRVD